MENETKTNPQFQEDLVEESKETFDFLKDKNYELSKNISLSILAKEDYIMLSKDEKIQFPAMFSFKCEEHKNENGIQISTKVPMDLICVIDHSGSMGGYKIQLVKETLSWVLTFLQPKDRLSIILFSDDAKILFPLKLASQKNKDQYFKDKINSIQSDSGTNIASGMNEAFNMIKQRKTKNKVTSVLLLSDGLDGGAFERIQNILENDEINEPFSIHSFGFGNDHDAELMNNIAHLKDGTFYYIEKLDQVEDCFLDALGALMSVIAKEIEIRVQAISNFPFQDFRIAEIYSKKLIFDMENKEYVMKIPYISAGISKDFVLELSIPPIQRILTQEQKKAKLLKVSMKAKDPKGNQANDYYNEKQLEINLMQTDEEKVMKNEFKVNKDVMLNYLRVKGAQRLEESKKCAENHYYKEGKLLLEEFIKMLEKKEYQQLAQEPPIIALLNDMKEGIKLLEPNEFLSKGSSFFVSQSSVHAFQHSSPCKAMSPYSSSMQKQMSVSKKSSFKIQNPISNFLADSDPVPPIQPTQLIPKVLAYDNLNTQNIQNEPLMNDFINNNNPTQPIEANPNSQTKSLDPELLEFTHQKVQIGPFGIPKLTAFANKLNPTEIKPVDPPLQQQPKQIIESPQSNKMMIEDPPIIKLNVVKTDPLNCMTPIVQKHPYPENAIQPSGSNKTELTSDTPEETQNPIKKPPSFSTFLNPLQYNQKFGTISKNQKSSLIKHQKIPHLLQKIEKPKYRFNIPVQNIQKPPQSVTPPYVTNSMSFSQINPQTGNLGDKPVLHTAPGQQQPQQSFTPPYVINLMSFSQIQPQTKNIGNKPVLHTVTGFYHHTPSKSNK